MTTTIDASDYYSYLTPSELDAMQYGILRRSGRYPYGSGKTGAAKYPWGAGSTQNKRNRDFLDYFDAIRREGKMSVTEACKMLGISTTDYRAARSAASAQQKQVQIHTAKRLRDKGWSNQKIAEKMFGNPKQESTVRSLLKQDAADKAHILQNIANTLEEGVKSKRFIDIGTGVEQHLGISADRLRVAVAMLKEKGYTVHKVQVEQLGTAPGNKTTIKVLAPPGTKYKDVNANKGQIQQLDALGKFSKDNGRTILGLKPPLSISSKRIDVNYAENGGGSADGVIYVRPGIRDLSLGTSHYAQVRIMVDGSHFLKGMAVYKNDLPAGVDLQFNTSKSKAELGNNKLDAFKPLKTKKLDDGTEVIDHDNPFGAQIKPNGQVLDEKTGKVTSAMNIINEEGDWGTWSKNLSSQFLSKQSADLAKRQLDETYDAARSTLDEIMALTNPSVRKKLLETFADGADSSAVDLKAASLPRQASHVILPIPSMKPTEVYAPNFKDGEPVVLIRYPHGGTFEIPELTVNNKVKEARANFGEHPPDAIGIHPDVAKQLSGADFDGDSVIVIPQGRGVTKIQTAAAIKELSDFDPRAEYPKYEGMKVLSEVRKQQEMGKVSNLITDMTIKGAPTQEIVRAVKHSMVVIDAAKHELDWKQSEINHGIKALREKYQAKPDDRAAGGSSTLISRAKSKDRKAVAVKVRGIDPLTGKKILVPKHPPFVDPKTGETRFRTEPRKKLEITDDAFTLTSGGSKAKPGTRIEAVYAEHSNKMKDLANEARRSLVNTKVDKADPAAAKVFENEVKSLNAKLNIAIRNRPLERQAQIYANETLAAKKADNPDMDKAQEKKIKAQALQQARARTHPDGTPTKKDQIEITEREWQAIQARAISPSKLSVILDNANIETVKKLATPRQTLLMNATNIGRAKALRANGYTQAEIAQQLGVSLTTLKNSLRKEG